MLSPSLRIKDTLSGGLVEFRAPGRMRMYVCGLTVYDYVHIGHARTLLVFDVLYRLIEAKGFDVKYVQNFTDVDDKIIMRARELGIEPSQLAETFMEEALRDFQLLNLKRPTVMPRATQHVGDMQRIISALVEGGYAYVTPSGVYYRVSRFPEYGKLSKKKPEQLLAGARIEPDPHKLDPADFALWKIYGDGPLWESPWGRGRPGWHIECSTMIHAHLGETIEIHGGGADLIFPHHENEIAQSEAYTGKPLSKVWMHVGLLNMRKEKMAKSLGNVIRIRDAISWWGPNTLRLYLLSSHYRNPLEFSLEGLKKAHENWRIIESAAHELLENPPTSSSEVDGAIDEFDEALSNDLNTPSAIAALVKLSRFIGRLAASHELTGSSTGVAKAFATMFDIMGFKLLEPGPEEVQKVERLVEMRTMLRREGRFDEADAVREKLRDMGYEITDYPDRSSWRKVERPDWSRTF